MGADANAHGLGTSGGLRPAYADVVAALRRGEAPPSRALATLTGHATGTDLAELVAELGSRPARRAPADVYRWLMLAPPSADLYHEEALHRFNAIEAKARAKGHVGCWSWSWVAEGCLVAYEATGQRRFAQLVIDRYLALLEHRDDRRGRADVLRDGPQPTWGLPVEWWQGHKRGSFTGGWTALVDTAGRVTYPVLRLARLLQSAGEPPMSGVTLEGLVDECANSLRVFDADFEEHPATGAGFYRRRSDGQVEPLNHSLSAGRALGELAALTGDRNAWGRVEAMARCFRWALRVDRRRAFVWPYRPEPGRPLAKRSNHVWKADVDASFALSCHEHGRAFTDADLDHFVRTFTRNIVMPSGELNARISREGAEPLLLARKRPTARVRAPGVVSWNQFGPREPRIHRRLAEEVATNVEVFPKGWFTSSRTGRAYAQRLLDHEPRRGRARRLEAVSGAGRRGRRSARR